MKRFTVLILALFIAAVSIMPAFGATPTNGASAMTQDMERKTKNATKKTYRKGKWVTVTSWHNGKRVTKKVWRKGATGTHWTAHKTKRGTKTVFRKVKNAIN